MVNTYIQCTIIYHTCVYCIGERVYNHGNTQIPHRHHQHRRCHHHTHFHFLGYFSPIFLLQ